LAIDEAGGCQALVTLSPLRLQVASNPDLRLVAEEDGELAFERVTVEYAGEAMGIYIRVPESGQGAPSTEDSSGGQG